MKPSVKAKLAGGVFQAEKGGANVGHERILKKKKEKKRNVRASQAVFGTRVKGCAAQQPTAVRRMLLGARIAGHTVHAALLAVASVEAAVVLRDVAAAPAHATARRGHASAGELEEKGKEEGRVIEWHARSPTTHQAAFPVSWPYLVGNGGGDEAEVCGTVDELLEMSMGARNVQNNVINVLHHATKTLVARRGEARRGEDEKMRNGM